MKLNQPTEDTFPTIYLVRTGSENWNRFLACLAISRGMKFKADGLGMMRRGERVGYLSEEHILAAVDLPFIPPEEREVPESALHEPELSRYWEHFERHQKTLFA